MSDAVESAAPPPVPERVRELCSMLIANGSMPAAQCRDLLYDELLRQQVSQRLNTVGLKLLHNPYATHWGVGPADDTAADDRLEWSNNFGMERGAMALLLIIWTKLVLPKRPAQEERRPTDGTVASLFPTNEPIPQPRVNIGREQLIAEFAGLLGGVTAMQKYIAQLTRANLIKAQGGLIEEGPLMALVVDERALGEELRREVLLNVLRHEQAAKSATAAADEMAASAAAEEES